MHEISLCRSILTIIQEKARELKAEKIISVRVGAGRLVAANPDIMRFAFEAVTKGTLAEGAKFIVEDEPALGYCEHCQQEAAIQNYFDACPLCNQYGLTIIRGESLEVLSMEVC